MKFQTYIIIFYSIPCIILIILYFIFGFKLLFLPQEIMIIDNLNFSYIEYISDLKIIPEELEKKIDFSYDNKYKKLSLGTFNKDIYCECFNNKSEKIIIKEIYICNFYNCELKPDKNKSKNYNIYKWKNSSFYAEISKYYFYQGINLKTKKCDEKIGFISCGFYDNIDIEICVKKDLMKCPYKFKNNKTNNIIFNELNMIFNIENKENLILENNISLYDFIPYINITNNKKINSIFKYSLKEFLKENDIYPKYKSNNDEVNLIPNNNNILKYDKNIDNNNTFIIKYEFKLISTINKCEEEKPTLRIIFICLLCILYLAYRVIIDPFANGLIMIFLGGSIIYILEKDYKELYNMYKESTRRLYMFYFLKLSENVIFLYHIYDARKINKIYDGHIWDSKFKNVLENEIRFMTVNIFLFLLSLMNFAIFVFSQRKKIKDLNATEIINIHQSNS